MVGQNRARRKGARKLWRGAGVVFCCLALAACVPGAELRDQTDAAADAASRGDSAHEGEAGRDGGASQDVSGPDRSAGADARREAGAADAARADTRGDDSGAPFGGTLTPGTSTLSLSAAGQQRSAQLVVPAAAATARRPLVMALHGNGDTSANFLSTSGLRQAAEARGLILVAPQGLTQSFEYLGTSLQGIDWDAYRSVAEGNIDLPLIAELMAQLRDSGSVDLDRVYLFGYSQGGYMAFRAAMEMADSVAAAVVAAASNPLPGSSLIANAARPIPIALVIGENDWAVEAARSTRDALRAAGHPVAYEEVAGAGHVPFPGDAAALLDWLLGYAL